ncbi:MAG: 4a-hydroxytetrahydrobiopterin dehydratase [Candidatus Aenigmarchaeota archaeon]|nr:4a-hydroxytetrahydrobiopterin dehydratase [Candidatus Aenigmarchaeota archaeon]
MKLSEKKCVPCEGGVAPFTEKQAKEYLSQVKNWELDGNHIEKTFRFEDFVQAMRFVNKVAEIAEQEDHHPDIKIKYNKVELELWTHSIKGLSENDFILAAKIDEIKI